VLSQSLTIWQPTKFVEATLFKLKIIPPLSLRTNFMLRTSKYMVRMAIALMLFQFLSPAFIPLVVQEIPTERATAFHAQHSSIVAPTFLKEKEEKEDSEITTITEPAAILDFASHSFNLTVSHSNKYSKSAEVIAINQPPRFALFCTLLI
jgi:hypothetical protein